MFQQFPDDAFSPRLGRNDERADVVIGCGIGIGPLFKQERRHLFVFVGHGKNERMQQEMVFQVRVGFRFEQERNDIVAAITHGENKRRITDSVLRVDVGLAGNHVPDFLDRAAAQGEKEFAWRRRRRVRGSVERAKDTMPLARRLFCQCVLLLCRHSRCC